MALPSTLSFQPKHDAVNSTLFTQVATPLSGPTANPNDTLTIPIPGTGRYGCFLDPNQISLSFQINNPAGATIQLDGSAYSFISRAVVMSSGSVISDTMEYGALAALFLDLANQSSRVAGMSIAAGCGTDDNLNTVRTGRSLAASTALNVCMPLIGTALDSTSIPDKLFPIGACADLQLVLYLNSQKNAVYSGGAAGNWSLSNFRLITNLVQVDETAMRMIDEQTQGAFKMSSTLWRSFNFTTGATDSATTCIIPVKASSVKSILSIWRPTANNEDLTKALQTSRHNPFGALTSTTRGSFYYQIGALSIPQVPIATAAEHYASFQNSWHQLAVPDSYDSNFRSGDYDAAAATTTGTPTGSFVAGVNMESFSGKSGVLHSGTNITGGTSCALTAVYPAALSAAHVITSFVCYDAVLEIAAGAVSCSW